MKALVLSLTAATGRGPRREKFGARLGAGALGVGGGRRLGRAAGVFLMHNFIVRKCEMYFCYIYFLLEM